MSPVAPKGVSAIGPSAEIIVLVGTQPTPFTSREASSPAGNPLPRTRPAISQVQTMMSGSRCMGDTGLMRGAQLAHTRPNAGQGPRLLT